MPAKIVKTRIQNKHDTETNWESKGSFVPLAGEFIVYDAESIEDPAKLKVGDGTHTLEELPFLGRGTTLIGIDKPTIDNDTVITYDGILKNYPVFGYNEGQMVREGTYEATNAGTYRVTFKLKEGFCWMDGTVDDVTLTWEIVKRSVKIKLNDTEENMHIGVYNSFENTISVTTDPENIPWTYTTSTNDTRIEVTSSENTLLIKCNESFNSNFTYSITITLEDTDNNETTSRQISLFYAPNLDAYTWEEISSAIGSDENNISFDIGTTKKIRLIPNARVYPSETNAIDTNVFVSEVFTHTEEDEYTGPKEILDGVVFSGFKDDNGNHTAITPEYDTIIKQLLPGITTLSFDDENRFIDEEGYVHYRCSNYELLCKFASQHRECSRPICVIDEERFEITEFGYDSETESVSFMFSPQDTGYETYLYVDRNGYTTTSDNGTNDRDNISSITFDSDTYVDKYLFYALGCLFNTCSCDTQQSGSTAGRAFEWELPDSSRPNLTTKPKSIEIIKSLSLDDTANVNITRTMATGDRLEFTEASLTIDNIIDTNSFEMYITVGGAPSPIYSSNTFNGDEYKVLTSITSISGNTFSVFYVLEHVFVHNTASVSTTKKPIYGTWIWDNSALLTYDNNDNKDFNISINFLSGDNVAFSSIQYKDGMLDYKTASPYISTKRVVSKGNVLYQNLLVMKFGDTPKYIDIDAYEFITTHAHAIHYGYAYGLTTAYFDTETESYEFRTNFVLDSKSIGISVKDALEPSLKHVLSDYAIDALSLPYHSELSSNTTTDRINRFGGGISYYTSGNKIASRDIVTNNPCYVHLYWHLDSNNFETPFGVDSNGNAVTNLSHREFINTIEAQTAGITPMFILGDCGHRYYYNTTEGYDDQYHHNVIACIFCGHKDYASKEEHTYNNYSVCRVCLHECNHSASDIDLSYSYASVDDIQHQVTASYGSGSCSHCGAVIDGAGTDSYFENHEFTKYEYESNNDSTHNIYRYCSKCDHKEISFFAKDNCNTGEYNNTCSYCGYQTEPAPD